MRSRSGPAVQVRAAGSAADPRRFVARSPMAAPPAGGAAIGAFGFDRYDPAVTSSAGDPGTGEERRHAEATGRTIAATGMTLWQGNLALAACALLFGSTFLVMKQAVAHLEPVPFLALRFAVAAIVLWPIAHRRPATIGERRDGALAGLSLLVGYVLQVYGLQYTSSSRSAFITYLLVVLVPIMEAVLLRVLPRMWSLASVALALVGMTLLSNPFTSSPSSHGFGLGEWLSLACAFAFAAHIVILGRVARRHDPIRFTLVQLWVVCGACAVLSIPSLLSGAGPGTLNGHVVAAVLYTGVAATAVAFVLMVAGQRVVPPARASLILLLEPVGAAVIGLIAGDRLGIGGAFGAVCILGAIALSELRRRPGPAVASPAGIN